MDNIEVLLIEDNPADVVLTREVFSEICPGYNIHWAKDGVEAINFIKQQDKFADVPRPDLILLDLNLPKKDGRHVLKEIKEMTDLRNIPIIILSTSKNEQDILTCYRLHANSYVTKPVELYDFIELAKKIHSYWIDTVNY